MRRGTAASGNLFELGGDGQERTERLAEGAFLFRGFARAALPQLMATILEVARVAPFRHMITPGGHRMSVAMTNCGAAGWVSDRRGYRYDRHDPESGRPWPAMPALFSDLAAAAAQTAGFPRFAADVCLINRYEPGARLSLHQDIDERDLAAPIVSISIGLPAIFMFGGLERAARPRRMALFSGDVAVWGGPVRRAFHGIAPLKEGDDPLAGCYRFNLTFRQAL